MSSSESSGGGRRVSDLAGMKIGEVAEQTGLSIRTLRHYDDLGVVTPPAALRAVSGSIPPQTWNGCC